MTNAFSSAFNCKKLTKLDIENCWEINDSKMENIFLSCPNIKDLNISQIDITDYTLSLIGIGYKNNLQSIFVKNCPNITQQGLNTLA